MSVTVDHRTLEADQLGLRTVGQVLAHLRKDRRLVVNLLIDGAEPDLRRMGVVNREILDGHTLFIETADPRQLALDALDEVGEQLKEADRLRVEASDLLERNGAPKAMEKLSGCFGTWRNAQESVLKTAQLLHIDLSTLLVDAISLTDLLAEFTTQLQDLKRALEHRDFVGLNDILKYEATRTSERWSLALLALRDRIAASAESTSLAA